MGMTNLSIAYTRAPLEKHVFGTLLVVQAPEARRIVLVLL
jgi:hypothetical protein